MTPRAVIATDRRLVLGNLRRVAPDDLRASRRRQSPGTRPADKGRPRSSSGKFLGPRGVKVGWDFFWSPQHRLLAHAVRLASTSVYIQPGEASPAPAGSGPMSFLAIDGISAEGSALAAPSVFCGQTNGPVPSALGGLEAPRVGRGPVGVVRRQTKQNPSGPITSTFFSVFFSTLPSTENAMPSRALLPFPPSPPPERRRSM